MFTTRWMVFGPATRSPSGSKESQLGSEDRSRGGGGQKGAVAGPNDGHGGRATGLSGPDDQSRGPKGDSTGGRGPDDDTGG